MVSANLARLLMSRGRRAQQEAEVGLVLTLAHNYRAWSMVDQIVADRATERPVERPPPPAAHDNHLSILLVRRPQDSVFWLQGHDVSDSSFNLEGNTKSAIVIIIQHVIHSSSHSFIYSFIHLWLYLFYHGV